MISIFEPEITERERTYLRECADSGWISSLGRFILDFEAGFAAYHAMPHAVAVSNCTTALHLALVGLGIGTGDEVLCPDLTFIAPANMIRLTGATPVLIDVEPVSWAIDPAKAAAKITPRTRAIMVIHPFGHSADMDPLLALAKKHGLKVIEDNAEAIGATYKGRLLGTLGDAGCFSFFANKIMTTGEGGMVLTDDPTFDEKLRVYRDHGMSRQRKYVHIVSGFNYRMTNMQAAVGLAQLERLDDIMTRRNKQAAHYERRFRGSNRVSWRPVAAYCEPVHWMTTITLRQESLRDPLLDYLKTKGIDSRQMVYPIHSSDPFKGENDPAEFPVSRSISLRSLHLPSSTGLRPEEIDQVCDVTLNWLERNDG